MPVVGGLDIDRKQLTFGYLDTVTGEVKRGQIAPADRARLRAWLARFAGRDEVSCSAIVSGIAGRGCGRDGHGRGQGRGRSCPGGGHRSQRP